MAQTIERDQLQDLTQQLFGGQTAPEAPAPAKKPRSKWVYLGGLLLIGAIVTFVLLRKGGDTPTYTPATVQRKDIAKTVSATGRLQALVTVQVGTQVSGTISELYADFNSQVKKGQVIARLDPSQLQAQLTQASANLAAAQASALTAQSNVVNTDAAIQAAQANQERLESVVAAAQLTYNRTNQLVTEQVAARNDLDTAQANLAQATAQRTQGTAQINQARAQAQGSRSQLQQARAQVAQASAAVQLAQVNLDKAVIIAPIDGTVVARNVDIGQTVAASLQAPTLFLIANDLTRMQVLADIDEADVGQLKPNSPVTFTVDAYPTETFRGTISQVRLSPQTVQNVVTYTAVIDVANPDLKLKPGMTANVTVTADRQKDVLTVPNAALRFRPEGVSGKPSRQGSGTIYRINGENLEPVNIRTGLSDGVNTQIVSGDLKEGDKIATPVQTANSRPAGGQRGTGFPGTGGRPGGGAGRIR